MFLTTLVCRSHRWHPRATTSFNRAQGGSDFDLDRLVARVRHATSTRMPPPRAAAWSSLRSAPGAVAGERRGDGRPDLDVVRGEAEALLDFHLLGGGLDVAELQRRTGNEHVTAMPCGTGAVRACRFVATRRGMIYRHTWRFAHGQDQGGRRPRQPDPAACRPTRPGRPLAEPVPTH